MSTTPTPYDRQSSFTTFSTPEAPTVGTGLEAEFNAIDVALDATQSRLAEIQREDGALANRIVTPDSMSVAALQLIGGWVPRGAWGTLIEYAANDLVTNGNITYVCVARHMSGDFAIDFNLNYWQALASDNAGANIPGPPGPQGPTGPQGPAGSGGGGANLSYTASPTGGVVASDTGTDATLTLADATNAGLMAPAQHTKLAGIATGATANATDASLRDRSTHTGTQAASTISDFNSVARAQIEATIIAGTNITLGLAGSGATRTITINASGGGGGGTWGSITGTLSAQTDLQSALDGKQPIDADLTAIAALTANGLLRKTAGTWAMDSATYLTANQTVTLSGDASGSGTTAITVTISDATVTGKLLTGYAVGANTALAATDSILAAFQKVQGQINNRQPLATVLTNTTASYTTALDTKLAGIATGATANATDAALRDRATHTGTQSIATILAAATARFFGRITASGGAGEELTGTQATTLLDVFTSALKGLVPASGGGTTNFLRADGTWVAPPGGTSITVGTTAPGSPTLNQLWLDTN